MSYKINTSPTFRKEMKRLVKKFPSLKSEVERLGESLTENPEQGTPIGKGCYKIRLSIASKGKGKSGGARVITNLTIINKTVYLLTIYDKAEQDNISDKELAELLKHISSEI
jgi:mRNA-degrading endonuclease RelE of RelBE toxin-antitoxin system